MKRWKRRGSSLMKIRFYFDEDMETVVADQLARRGIDVLTTRDADRLGTDDWSQLRHSTREGRVICTHDKHFIKMLEQNPQHAGVAYFRGGRRSIGAMVKKLIEIHRHESAEDWKNVLKYL